MPEVVSSSAGRGGKAVRSRRNGCEDDALVRAGADIAVGREREAQVEAPAHARPDLVEEAHWTLAATGSGTPPASTCSKWRFASSSSPLRKKARASSSRTRTSPGCWTSMAWKAADGLVQQPPRARRRRGRAAAMPPTPPGHRGRPCWPAPHLASTGGRRMASASAKRPAAISARASSIRRRRQESRERTAPPPSSAAPKAARGERETGGNRKSAEEQTGRGRRLAEERADVSKPLTLKEWSGGRKRGWQDLPPSLGTV